MKNILVAMFLASATGFAASPLAKKTSNFGIPGLSMSSNVALTNNFLIDGKSMSNKKPAVMGEFALGYTRYFKAGIFGSSVHLPSLPSRYANLTTSFLTSNVALGTNVFEVVPATLPFDTETMYLKPYVSASYDFGLDWHNLTVSYNKSMFPGKKERNSGYVNANYEVYWNGFTFAGDYKKEIEKLKLDSMGVSAAYNYMGAKFKVGYSKSKSKKCTRQQAATLRSGANARLEADPDASNIQNITTSSIRTIAGLQDTASAASFMYGTLLQIFAPELECYPVRGGKTMSAEVAYTVDSFTLTAGVNKFTPDSLPFDADAPTDIENAVLEEAGSTPAPEFFSTVKPKSKAQFIVSLSSEL